MLKKLIDSRMTVFLVEDLAKIFNIKNRAYLLVYLNRLVNRGDLIRLRRGIYTFTDEYSRIALANKIKRPSYVSLQRVLFDSGIIFQDYSNTITSVSNNTFSVKLGDIQYSYFKFKDEILVNPIGIISDSLGMRATAERAICDTIYLSKDFYFDNLKNIDKDKLLEIATIYNKRVIKEVERYA